MMAALCRIFVMTAGRAPSQRSRRDRTLSIMIAAQEGAQASPLCIISATVLWSCNRNEDSATESLL
jgi:hypothetical protein